MDERRSKPAPKRDLVIRALTAEIWDGRRRPGDQLPYRRALEQRFGVTTATVQEAFAQLKADGFVTARGRWGTYVAERPPCFHRLGIAFPSHPTSSSWSRFWHALHQCAPAVMGGQGAAPRFYYNIDRVLSVPSVQDLLADVERRRLAGLIFAGSPHAFIGTPLLAADGMPRVCLASQPNPAFPQVPAVYPDHAVFYDQALRSVAGAGCRRAAVVTTGPLFPDYDAALQRLGAAAGVEVRRSWVMCIGLPQVGHLGNWLELLMDRERRARPDALIVADDHLVPALQAGLAATRLRVPDDLRVVALAHDPSPEDNWAPIIRLGYHGADVLRACLGALACLRAGETPPPLTLIPPEFLDA